jgi:chlorite dismutase
MNKDSDEQQLDISEKGRLKDGTIISLDRRLFFQFYAFGNCHETNTVTKCLRKSSIDGVLYIDINDPYGIGFLTMNEDPSYFATTLREILNEGPFKKLSIKQEFTMLGRTYSFGYEPDLQQTLLTGPRKKVLDPDWRWAIWYPLRRKKNFERLPEDEQRAILGEHGKLGFKFGKAGLAKDIRLACHGIDKNDNDFVIGVIGRKLHPLSACIEAMRKTRQTSEYLESLGPFFIGRAVWQSKI